MACLYCGKDIGLVRLLRDKEFCSAAHREHYRERLGKALDQIGSPEPSPAGIAGFRSYSFICSGNQQYSAAPWDLGTLGHPIKIRKSWPVTVTPILGGEAVPLTSVSPAAATGGSHSAGEEMTGGSSAVVDLNPLRPPEPALGPAAPPAVNRAVNLRIANAVPRRLPPARTAVRRPTRLGVRLPGFEIAPEAPEVRAEDRPEPVPAPADVAMPLRPAPVMREVNPAAVDATCRSLALRLPHADTLSVSGTRVEACTEWMRSPSPAPASVTVGLRIVATPAALTQEAANALRFPEFRGLEAVEDEILGLRVAPMAEAVPVPPASPVQSMPAFEPFAPMLIEGYRNGFFTRLPRVTDPVLSFPAAAAGVVPAPGPCPVESMPAFEAYSPVALDIPHAPINRLPEMRLAAPTPVPAICESMAENLPLGVAPEAGHPVAGGRLSLVSAVRLPGVESLQSSSRAQVQTAPPAETAAPIPVESWKAIAGSEVSELPAQPPLALPQLFLSQSLEVGSAGLESAAPHAAAPEPRQPDSSVADLRLISSLPAKPSPIQSKPQPTTIIVAGFAATEFYCQRGTANVRRQLMWHQPVIAAVPPRFGLRLAAERHEDLSPLKPTVQPPKIKEIVPKRPGAKQPVSPWVRHAPKIAAGLLVVAFLWFGGHAVKVSNQAAGRGGSGSETASAESTTAGESNGLAARISRAIASRAAVQMNDNFHDGMESWGSAPHAFAEGWSRSPSGYVRTGTMALFQPSQSFTDYRLEFLGQIENKSMGWVMRARDNQNYYAMKFTVIQAGLRPVIAMAHYPVVDGKRATRLQVPLSVMIHRDMPFHVTVDVHGNHFRAAVEGEEVESWTDDTAPSGAAGFFSEAGEHARIYWMKVSKNTDWLGNVCSYLSGGNPTQAELWGPGIPANVPQPTSPSRPWDVRIAEAGLIALSGPQRVRILKYRRIRPWSI